jgi:DNA-binding LacI/PurR family transcriptional regulator
MNTFRIPTLQDVATAAGVSVATVSRFRRGTRRFAPDVEARIAAAATTLGYRDNQVARSLVTGRTGTVGLVVLDLSNPHFTGLVQGAHRVALEHRMSVAFVDTAESQAPERQLVEALAQRVDGLVVSARLAGGALDWISQLGKPVVFFGHLGLPGSHSVSTDGHAAATLLGRHLAELGHRDVVYLGFAPSRWSAERQRGLREALAAAGARLTVCAVDAPSAEAGEAAAAQVLLGSRRGAAPDRPDAVVAYNDLVAIGFMHEARRLGVVVPAQVSVAGFDDIELASHVSPMLTTVAMNSRAMGAVAMQRLMQLMAGDLPRPFDETLEPRLIVRGSSGPPPRHLSLSTPFTGRLSP